MRVNVTFFICLISFSSAAQQFNYTVSAIPDTLIQNSNAVIRLHQRDITINSQRSMEIREKRIVTVLNEQGIHALDAEVHYDKATAVKSIEATVFNANGLELKKIKRKDFRDQAAIDGITMFSDSRILTLEYTPTQYPFTFVYERVTETSNTAFIPQWMPINDYFVSVEKAVLSVRFPMDVGFKWKEFNFGTYAVEKTAETSTTILYVLKNAPALKVEEYSPMAKVLPRVMLGLEKFHIEGVDGSAKTWSEFGKWYSEKLLSGTTELPESTKTKVKSLIGNETDPVKKARIIYNYVQQKSRYVSIQVGIGGWKPMLANDVDRLGYGDCKALSNYTRALLDVVGVQSYNTILYGDGYKRDIEPDFVSMQGNHMILAIPANEKYIWLECTSQTDPFGYQGTFTDDRNVLVIKPEGTEIVRTIDYGDATNTQISTGRYQLTATGDLEGAVDIITTGTQYARAARLESMSPLEKERHYKDYWDNIGNLKISKIDLQNDQQGINFTETTEITAAGYGKKSGDRLIFPVNAFNQQTTSLKKIRNRRTPFEIQRGYLDQDAIEIILPDGYNIEAIPDAIHIATKFGEYKASVKTIKENELKYERSVFVKKGEYPSSDYEEYRQFLEKIARYDNAKIILIKKI